MSTLILSSTTGGGHDACAQAIKEVYDKHQVDSQIVDALGFVSSKFNRFVSWGHVFIYRRIPWLFGWGYRFTEHHPELSEKDAAMYHLLAKGADALGDFLKQGKYDTVICTHPFASLMLTETQRRYHLPAKTALVSTDYTCSPCVKDSEMDLFFIPHGSLTEDFLCDNITKEKIVPTGIPVRQMFYRSGDKISAKKTYGVSPDHRHLVMACGSMGCGPIEELAQILTQEEAGNRELTIACGTNEKLKEKLEKRFAGKKNLHVRGFVADMSELLDSADLFVTKPGGLSVTEAAAKDIPMVFIHAVDGCEAYNSRFFCDLGGAVTADDVQSLAEVCRGLLADEAACEAMRASLRAREKRNSAEEIFRIMEKEPARV